MTPASKVFCPLDFGALALFLQRFSDFWRLHLQYKMIILNPTGLAMKIYEILRNRHAFYRLLSALRA
jgi:hypothetical protein